MMYEKLITRTVNCNNSNYKKANRQSNDIKFIVIHFTANDGDSDEGNAKYFQAPGRGASAHYFVDDDSITESVHWKNIAWHCGGSIYNDVNKTGGAKLRGICTNSNSIGIEMCDTNRNGVYDLSTATWTRAVNLIRALMSDFSIDINHVVRHFDVTGKYCPRYFCPPYGSNDSWNKFKNDIVSLNTQNQQVELDDYTEKEIWTHLINCGLTPCGTAGLMGNLYAESSLRANNLQNNGNTTLCVTDDEFVSLLDSGEYSRDKFINDKYGFGIAQWTFWSRKQALYDYIKKEGVSFGSTKYQLNYLINELKNYKQLYGLLCTTDSIKEASDAVLINYEKPANQDDTVKNKRYAYSMVIYDRYMNKEYKVRVTASALNYRQGPGTSYKVNGVIRDKGVYTIVDEIDGWGKLKSGAGWICLKYTSRL